MFFNVAAGDSRAVIQRNGDAIALTSDHKPDREDEAVSPLNLLFGNNLPDLPPCHLILQTQTSRLPLLTFDRHVFAQQGVVSFPTAGQAALTVS